MVCEGKDGYFGGINASNLFSMRKSVSVREGGYDRKFDLQAGRLVNLDFYKRISELGDFQTVHLLGEDAFHQYHGGVTTNGSPTYYGHMPKQARRLCSSSEK